MSQHYFDPKKPSRAVIANGPNGGCVLWWVGHALDLEIALVGGDPEDLGLDDAPPGLSIWEGRYAYFNDSHPMGPDEGCTSLPKGAFRVLTDEEWTLVREGRAPWNERDWILTGPA